MGRPKKWEQLTIQDDYMFKLVMRRKRICKKMLEKILRIKIRDIKYIEEEKTLKHRYYGRGVRLDVYVEDEKKTIYNVEMQVRKPSWKVLAKRTRYYQSMIDVSLLNESMDYDALNKCFIIFICPFDPIGEGRHYYSFRTRCDQNTKRVMPDESIKIILNAKGTLDDVADDVKAFLNYVNGVLSNDAFVQEIDHEIHELKKLEEERVRYVKIAQKMREEWKEGRKAGFAKGEAKGRREGESRLQALICKLLAAKRFDDVEKVTDTKKLAALYAEFGM